MKLMSSLSQPTEEKKSFEVPLEVKSGPIWSKLAKNRKKRVIGNRATPIVNPSEFKNCILNCIKKKYNFLVKSLHLENVARLGEVR